MEKEKILEWMDKLIEGFDILRNNKFFEPEKGWKTPLICGETHEKRISIYSGVELICQVCGFEMETEFHDVDGEMWKWISFKYNGYEFYENFRFEE